MLSLKTGSFIFLSMFLFNLGTFNIKAQELPEYDEISVFIEFPRIGGREIAAVIKGEELFLPVVDLFDFLKIRNVPSSGLESVSGFFINPEAVYYISRTESIIRYMDKTFNLNAGDIIRTESNLYLRSSYYGKVFGLECNFNFRGLSVTVNSKLELPFIREMRQEEMRKNLTRLTGEIKADTSIGRSYQSFKFGMADWSAYASEEIKGKSETRLNLALGGMILGGDATASLYYNSADPFKEKQQYYLWRYVNNDFRALRQVMAGKIATNAISSLYNPVLGINITNTPTTYRRSFGSYTLTDRTEPGWIVELYVNNTLVDYVKADASGFFKFEVPLVYGNSIVNLKFYGPWGEERSREQNINIPFNFLPVNTMEYSVKAGIVEDSLRSRFTQARINYGLIPSITIGGGLEYLSSVSSGPAMPFVNASYRVTNNLLFSGEYTYGVRAKGTLSYRLPSNLQFDLDYTWYDKNQKAINYDYREERKATVSLPLKIKKFSSYQRLTFYQIVYPTSDYATVEWLFSASLFGVNTNITTYALDVSNSNPYFYSNLSMAFLIPGGFTLMPQIQYGYTQHGLKSTKLTLEKHFLDHAFLNLSYEHVFSNKMNLAELGLRYDFSFAQTGVSLRQLDKKTTFIQYARGSLINDTKTKYLRADNRTNVGKGGISIIAFIDLNTNGKKDPGEPRANGLNLRVNGGSVEKRDRDTTIHIFGLEPYTSYFIELDPNSFDNVSWRLPKQSLSVIVDPDIMKTIEIPITVAGEATGRVIIDKEGEINGIGRIIVGYYKSTLEPVAKTLTEEDGYYSYFGLAPGQYFVKIDTSQLKKLGMTAAPDSIPFKIKAGIDGDIVDGLDFTLRMKPADSTAIIPVAPIKPVIRKDTTYMVVHEVVQELVTITEDSYAIQLGAFKRKANADALRRKLERLLGKKVDIVVEGDFYKVRIPDLKDRAEVDEHLVILRLNGITEVWVIKLKAKQQQLVIFEKVDSIARVTETIVQQPVPVSASDMSVQVGAFRQEAYALALKNKLSTSIENMVVIINENGYYKVRVTGFSSMQEMEKLLPSLGLLGMRDIWIIPLKKRDEPLPEVQQPVVKEPEIVQTDTTKKVIEKIIEVPVIEEKPVVPQPTIALRVGEFYKKSQADRAQRRISSKLKLPAEVVQQYDYYYILITGFYTAQETFKYYPELAVLGYNKISRVEQK